LGGAVCVLAGYAQTTAAMTAADKEPINVALNAFIRVPTPKNPRMDFE
jgi:hydrogenase maturation factor